MAVLVDLVGHGAAFGDAEAVVEEEVGDAGEEAGGGDAVVFGFRQQRTKQGAAGALAAGFGVQDDGADLGEVRAVEVEGAAAEEVGFGGGLGWGVGGGFGEGFGYGEVADVFADFGVAATEEGAVVRRGS